MEIVIVNERAFEFIKNGNKKIEVRKDGAFFCNFEPGKIFYFLELKNRQKVLAKIIRINTYQNLTDLILNEPMEIVNPYPDIVTIEDSILLYKKHYKNKISGDWISIHFSLI